MPQLELSIVLNATIGIAPEQALPLWFNRSAVEGLFVGSLMSKVGVLLEVKGLKTFFKSAEGPIRAVDGVDLSIHDGETVALVGESGCGKSVFSMSLARLIPRPGYHPAGKIMFKGTDVLEMNDNQLTGLRGGEISYIFQEPGSSLNPVFRVGYQIEEAVRLHKPKSGPATGEPRARVVELLEMVGLPDPIRRMQAYPHELSGGMQQRIMIAMALACSPSLLIADEPTTALDVTIQAQILELLSGLQRKLGMAILLITHNLGLVADMARNVCVMYSGRVIESGPTEELLLKPAHPYTRGLLDAVPRLKRTGPLKGIPGTVPHPAHLPPGCKFAPRCLKKKDICEKSEPALELNSKNRCVRCFFPLEP
ncbi:MAG: ABC transporter ATP-binding protein [bacterium]